MIVYTPTLPASTILSVIALLMLMPIFSFSAELLVNKTISKNNIIFSTVITSLVCCYLSFQLYSTRVKIVQETLIMDSLSYTKSIPLNEIKGVTFYDNHLPEPYHTQWRKNGIGLYGYSVGYFKSIYNRDIYLHATTPPYMVLVLKGEKSRVIVSVDKVFYEKLKSQMEINQTEQQ